MVYGHSFGPDFYWKEGEMDGDVKKSKRPCTVAQALFSMSKKDWNAMCRDVFPGVSPDYIGLDTVMEKIMETDTVSNLSVPVEVWIDEEGWHRVDVWDDSGELDETEGGWSPPPG